MSQQANREFISSLSQIRAQISSLAPNDGDTLIKIGVSLEELTTKLPEDLSEVVELLMLCLGGLQAIYQETMPDFAQLVRTIGAAMVACEQAISLQNHPICKQMLAQAQNALQLAIGEQSPAEEQAVEPAEPEIAPEIITDEPLAPSSKMSLDDVSALFMQIGAADRAELGKMRDALKEIVAEEATNAAARKLLTKAARDLNKLAQGKSKNADELFASVGETLEQAGFAIQEDDAKPARAETKTQAAATLKAVEAPIEKAAPAVKETNTKAVEEKPFEEMLPDELPPDSDAPLINEFITESGEYIEASEAALLSLETDPDNLEDVNTVFRAFHTIKGTSAFLGLKRLSELAHHAESLLSRVRDREIRFTGGYADLALRSVDALKEMLVSIRQALDGAPMSLPENYADLMRVLMNPEANGVSGEASESSEASLRLGDILVAQEKVTREEVEAAVENKGDEPLSLNLVKSSAVTTTEVAQALRTQQKLAAPTNDSRATTETSVRVRTDRLDSLIDMVGELVIAQSMLASDENVQNGMQIELARKISHAGKIVRELQDLSMAMRMVPLKATFQKMARLVRDVSQKCGKQVEFITEGEDTEIDRNMVDIIADPLVHMVRNAVDHGIEQPDMRAEAGKSRIGKVRLAAYHAGGNVVVELQDDGKGLDKEKILQKALSKGLIESDKGLTETEIFQMIFAPGFSTAEQVTDMSGRGVGMDVVRRNIEAMRGRVEITSEKGKGSTFTVRLPLTLAITDGMLVRIGGERFIVPTVNIQLSFSPTENMISTVSGRGEMVLLRGELLPIIRLHRLFEVQNAVEQTTKGLLMIVADGRRRCALLVDELLGQQQVVAKSLGQGIGKIQGISGGAILGDGRVGLILDTAEIVALARQAGNASDRRDSLKNSPHKTQQAA